VRRRGKDPTLALKGGPKPTVGGDPRVEHEGEKRSPQSRRRSGGKGRLGREPASWETGRRKRDRLRDDVEGGPGLVFHRMLRGKIIWRRRKLNITLRSPSQKAEKGTSFKRGGMADGGVAA